MSSNSEIKLITLEETLLKKKKDIERIWSEAKWLYIVIGIFMGLLIFPASYLVLRNPSELLSSLVPEAFGIAFTAILIDRFNLIRHRQDEIKDLKRSLLIGASSISNEVAKDSLHQLAKLGWARGEQSVLKHSDLSWSNLESADMWRFHMDNANLSSAKLKNAYLYLCSLKNANFTSANLTDSDLRGADLSGANLYRADLRGAKISGLSVNKKYREAILDKTTILPDGSNWETPEDLKKFGCIFDYETPKSRKSIYYND